MENDFPEEVLQFMNDTYNPMGFLEYLTEEEKRKYRREEKNLNKQLQELKEDYNEIAGERLSCQILLGHIKEKIGENKFTEMTVYLKSLNSIHLQKIYTLLK
jgi:hypothetical protein